MTTVAYKVEPVGDQWSLMREGQSNMLYATRSAAYEVAVAEAEGELRLGHDVIVHVLCGDESAANGSGSGAARAD